MTASKISWCERSDWNPIRGCTRVSEGCRRCYAERIAARFSGPGHPFHGFAERTKTGPRWTGKVELQEGRLDLPLRWRKPARIFVSSTSDVFHEALPDEAIDKIFAVMALAPQHVFMVLTKRAGRMREYLTADRRFERCGAVDDLFPQRTDASRAARDLLARQTAPGFSAPLENIWLGVSVEDQAHADARIPDLLATPAALRWISAEPLLGPVDLTGALPCILSRGIGNDPGYSTIDWVVAGGESQGSDRPSHPDWFRSLRDQCQAARVPFHFKQWGDWRPDNLLDNPRRRGLLMRSDGRRPSDSDIGRMLDGTFDFTGYQHFSDVGAGSRTLDGRIWDEFPERRTS
jgi:protein gp37